MPDRPPTPDMPLAKSLRRPGPAQFDILGFQWSFLIGYQERPVRIGPGALPIRPARPIELAHPAGVRTASAHMPPGRVAARAASALDFQWQ